MIRTWAMIRTMMFCLVVGGMLAPGRAAAGTFQAESVFLFSGSVAGRLAAADEAEPLCMQLLVLDLTQRTVCHHEVVALKTDSQQTAGTVVRYQSRIRLPEAPCLLEYLVFDRSTDCFELFVRQVNPKAPGWPEVTTVTYEVPALPRTGFRQFSRSLLYQASRPVELARNGLLWQSITEFSLRPPGERADLYRRLKLACAYVNYSSAAQNAMRRRYGRLRLPFSVLPSMYHIAVHADNLAFLGETLASNDGAYPTTADLSRLQRIHDEAGAIHSCCLYLCMDRLVADDFDQATFRTDFAALDTAARTGALQALVHEIYGQTSHQLFGPPTIAVDDLPRDSLLVLARKIRWASHSLQQ
ncbi:MAG: hypothetical protein JXQ27_17385 [Acidobacteria bacterium]|nr:hypothetical protein [Acidobacteriota bacterium]